MRCARLPAQPRKFVLGEVTMLSLSVRHRFRHALYRLAAPKIYLLLLLLQQRLLHVSPNRLGRRMRGRSVRSNKEITLS